MGCIQGHDLCCGKYSMADMMADSFSAQHHFVLHITTSDVSCRWQNGEHDKLQFSWRCERWTSHPSVWSVWVNVTTGQPNVGPSAIQAIKKNVHLILEGKMFLEDTLEI